MPEVSVIVPVYNTEKYLRRCVDSILAQTFRDIEVILVDDGSTDGSGAVCDEYAEKDGRIVAIHKENGGVSSARNRGLDIARGRYIMFCDSDDYVAERWIEELYKLIILNDVELGICKFFFSNSKKDIDDTENKNGIKIFTKKEFLYENNRFSSSTVNKIFLGSIIKENKICFSEDISHGEDMLFVLNYFNHAKCGIATMETPLYGYMSNTNSLTKVYVPDF